MKYNNKNINIGNDVKIGINVKIGDNSSIFDNVEIGDNTVIGNNCLIGEPVANYYTDLNYKNPILIIGSNSLIRSNTILYAGSKLGSFLSTGHFSTIRENTVMGHHCSIGSYNDVQGTCVIGNYCRFQSYVGIGQHSKVGNFVFIFPNVILTNDPTPPSNDMVGATIGDYTQIATGAVILPGCIVGEQSLIAANSAVSGAYEADSFISGSPAKFMGKLSKMPFFNTQGKRHYPWMHNFSRNMPWEQIGYDEWIKNNTND
jgi:acetyltransferase-like isoleucine patch superfamily enzyme